MKKLIFCLVLFVAITGALSAWEPNDLTKFPVGMKEGDWILNLGIGFGERFHSGRDYTYIPPIRLSFDRNKGLGDKNLPFFFGGIVSYSGEGYKTIWDEWFIHKIMTGFRFGYHFNWDVKNLDTYAVTTAGWIFHAGDYHSYYNEYGTFFMDVNLGVRYFISDWFGFWSELGGGYSSLSYISLGVSFKF